LVHPARDGPGLGKDIQVVPPRFYYDSGQIGAATVKYDADHFSAGLTRSGQFTLDFPAYCVTAFGALDNQAVDPTAAPGDPLLTPVDRCKRLQVPSSSRGQRRLLPAHGLREEQGRSARQLRLQVHVRRRRDGWTVGALLRPGRRHHARARLELPTEGQLLRAGRSAAAHGTAGAYLFDVRGLRTFDLVRGCMDNSECTSGNCDVMAGHCI
jgi:hypothetical protein